MCSAIDFSIGTVSNQVELSQSISYKAVNHMESFEYCDASAFLIRDLYRML